MGARYIVPYARLQAWLEHVSATEGDRLELSYDHYLSMIRRLLECVPVDSDWYFAEYPGVAQSVARGNFRSALQHYLTHGYFEDRVPFAPGAASVQMPPAFDWLRGKVTARPIGGKLRVRLSAKALRETVTALIWTVPVDEDYYRWANPGVADAIAKGDFKSGAAHFAAHGYFEGRFPFQINVDDNWYFTQYPDIAVRLERGQARSAQDHFERVGYREGRLPFANPWVN